MNEKNIEKMNYLSKIVLKFILVSVVCFLSISALLAQSDITINDLNGKWEILSNESEFSFRITTVWVFPVTGNMGGLNGEINFDKKSTNDFVHLTLNPSTLNTGNDKRDEHLRSEDFFYVNKYPLIEFTGGSIDLADSDELIYHVKGNLTIRGVRREETIPVKLLGYVNDSKNKIEFEGSVQINRNEYNVDFTGRIIADKAKVKFSIIAQKKK
jgi:polyisoprenoid-binding protein YceI